jgi:hypothetical protein
VVDFAPVQTAAQHPPSIRLFNVIRHRTSVTSVGRPAYYLQQRTVPVLFSFRAG